MPARKPLVIISGLVQQLPTGDTLDAPVSEVDVIALTNGSSSAATIGTPVYISAANTFQPSRANAALTAKVLGLVRDASVAASSQGIVQTDGVLAATTAQWDAITGQTGGLTSGATYFLSAAVAGKLTTTAPTATNEYVLAVGEAISTTTLEIASQPRILL